MSLGEGNALPYRVANRGGGGGRRDKGRREGRRVHDREICPASMVKVKVHFPGPKKQ